MNRNKETDVDEPPRFYGVDATDEFATLCEATPLEDGTIYLRFVIVDKTKSAKATDR